MSIQLSVLEINKQIKSPNDAFVSVDAETCFSGVEVIVSVSNLAASTIYKLTLTDKLPLNKEFSDEIIPVFINIPKTAPRSGIYKFDLRLQETPYHLFELKLRNAENPNDEPIIEEFGIECGSDNLPLLTPTPTHTVTSTPTHTPTITSTPTNSQALINIFDSNVILEKDEFLFQTDRTNWTRQELIDTYPFIDESTDTIYIRKPNENLVKKLQFDGDNAKVVDYILVPSQTPTHTSTPTTTPTFTPTNSVTPSFTLTNTVTGSNTPSVTVSPTVTITNTITNTLTPSTTPTNTPTITNTITGTLLSTQTPTATNTPTHSFTPTTTGTPTVTQTNTNTSSNTPTITNTATPTTTPTTTPSASVTASATPTNTETPTVTPTNTLTPTITATTTYTPSTTVTSTTTVTNTVTPTDVTPYNIEIVFPDNQIIDCDQDSVIAVLKYSNIKPDGRKYNWSISSRRFELTDSEVINECSISPSEGYFFGKDSVDYIEVILSNFVISDNRIILTVTTTDNQAGLTTDSEQQIFTCEG